MIDHADKEWLRLERQAEVIREYAMIAASAFLAGLPWALWITDAIPPVTRW